jgi:hypothetical protein
MSTFVGDTPYALRNDFQRIVTIEPTLAWRPRRAAAPAPRAGHGHRGDSISCAHRRLPLTSDPVLFWLDGHWSRMTAKEQSPQSSASGKSWSATRSGMSCSLTTRLLLKAINVREHNGS